MHAHAHTELSQQVHTASIHSHVTHFTTYSHTIRTHLEAHTPRIFICTVSSPTLHSNFTHTSPVYLHFTASSHALQVNLVH